MEDFVPFEIAKQLKEKGFREECLAYYHTDGELLYNRDQYRGGDYKSLLRSYNSSPKNPIGCEQIDASTITQVLKWLRAEYSIHISTKPYSCEDGLMWMYEIRKFKKYIVFVMANKTGFTKEEQASLAGIEYVIDNLI